MATEVKIPDIGDYKDVPIIEVHVKEGDAVNADDPLVSLESDKATMEVPAPSAGVIEKLLIKLGDKVSEGHPIVLLKSGDGAATPEPPSLIEQQEPAPVPPPPAAGPGEAERSGSAGGFRAGACEPERPAPCTRTRYRPHELFAARARRAGSPRTT